MKRVTLLLAVLAVSSACKGNQADPPQQQGRGGRRGGGAGLAFAVDVMPVEAKKAPYLITSPGTVDAFERVQVTARVSGAVDRVAFTEGQEVKKGDTLIVIDSQRYQLAVNSAKAALDKAEAAVKDNDAQVARREATLAKSPGLITGEELETYRTKSVAAKADRSVAQQALQTAQLNLRDSIVRAPMEGVIQTRTVETGQYLQPGYVMATLLRSEPLLLRFSVEPQEAPRLKPGIIASFTMRETQRKFTAKITLVAGAADVATHMVGVTAEVQVEDGHKYWLRPGSFCDVTVEIDATREAALIPRLAARATDHGYVAYVVENDVAHERVLALGMSTRDGWVEVRSGIVKGDLLVVRGAEALNEGAKVKATQISPDALAKNAPDQPDAADAGPGDAKPRRKRDGGGAPSGAPSAGGAP